MNPAFSVLWLTTLIGAGQGLFIALVVLQSLGMGPQGASRPGFFALGGLLALALTAAGLLASFWHLGRPERAWRAAAMWRTSWLSREVIVLPLFMGAVALWTLGHYSAAYPTVALGWVGVLLAAALYLCTAMIYASIRFLREWASPYTLLNYTLIGLASGTLLGAVLAAFNAPTIADDLGRAALALTLAALATRALSLRRNALLKPRSTLQSAIGIRHPVIRQRSMGFMGGSFNTREFFHGRSAGALRWVLWWFLVAGFALPALLLGLVLAAGLDADHKPWILAVAFVVQFAGLLAERWFFFAQANHPQNLYYQAVS
jgi:DMSO reductase anchor subunit